MKKFIVIHLFFVTVLLSTLQADGARFVHEWAVDLYYANGALADDRKSSYRDWQIRTIKLKQKYPSLKKALRYGEAKLAYNASYLWGFSDLTEVILQ